MDRSEAMSLADTNLEPPNFQVPQARSFFRWPRNTSLNVTLNYVESAKQAQCKRGGTTIPSLAKNTTITAILTISILATASGQALAACGGFRPSRNYSNHSTATNYYSTTSIAKAVSHTASAPAAKGKYLVIQEAKPSTGLSLNATVNPTVNRGMFDTLSAAQETAEIWRDVMPGWEVKVVEISMNK